MLAVWLSIAQDGPIGTYDAGDFVSYYLLALYVRQMTSAWVSWVIDGEIREGVLALKLLHPINPIHDYLAENLADKVLRLLVVTPVLLIVVLLIPDVHYVLTPLNFLFFLLALTIAWYIRFIVEYIVGILSFWISQAMTIQDIFWMFFLLLGGVVAPLDLLPTWLSSIAHYLPFRYMMSFPIEIMLGRVTGPSLLTGFFIGLVWIVIFQIIYRMLWRQGLKVFGAYGS
jgi:ABC-2 type transport system permease protein